MLHPLPPEQLSPCHWAQPAAIAALLIACMMHAHLICIDLLFSRVFTSIEHTVRDQLLAVVEADLLIQTHGSAMGNLMFMKWVGLTSVSADNSRQPSSRCVSMVQSVM